MTDMANDKQRKVYFGAIERELDNVSEFLYEVADHEDPVWDLYAKFRDRIAQIKKESKVD